MTEFTTLLNETDKGNVTNHATNLQAPRVELTRQLTRIEVLFGPNRG